MKATDPPTKRHRTKSAPSHSGRSDERDVDASEESDDGAGSQNPDDDAQPPDFEPYHEDAQPRDFEFEDFGLDPAGSQPLDPAGVEPTQPDDEDQMIDSLVISEPTYDPIVSYDQMMDSLVHMNEQLNSVVVVSNAWVVELQPDTFMHELAEAISNFAAKVAMMMTEMANIKDDPEVNNYFRRLTDLKSRSVELKMEYVNFKDAVVRSRTVQE